MDKTQNSPKSQGFLFPAYLYCLYFPHNDTILSILQVQVKYPKIFNIFLLSAIKNFQRNRIFSLFSYFLF